MCVLNIRQATGYPVLFIQSEKANIGALCWRASIAHSIPRTAISTVVFPAKAQWMFVKFRCAKQNVRYALFVNIWCTIQQ
jgi:hypothetical protein